MARRVEGSLLEIALGDGQNAFARVLPDPLFAFYVVRDDLPLEPRRLINVPPAFTIAVMKSAVTSGRWPVIAKWPLEDALKAPVRFFKQDVLTGDLSIYLNGDERPASLAECANLECAAVWSPEHVEDRLRDFIAGIPNKWVDSMKLKVGDGGDKPGGPGVRMGR